MIVRKAIRQSGFRAKTEKRQIVLKQSRVNRVLQV